MRCLSLVVIGLILTAAPAEARTGDKSGRMRYGPARDQLLEYTPGKRGMPLVVSLPCQGGEAKCLGDVALTQGLLIEGYSVANIGEAPSVNSESAPHSSTPADVALAIAYLRGTKLDFDHDRIVLIGEGYGAGIVTKLLADPAPLPAVTVPRASIAGALLINGQGMDLPSDSATSMPPFAVGYATSSHKLRDQSQAFAKRLDAAGVHVEFGQLAIGDDQGFGGSPLRRVYKIIGMLRRLLAVPARP